MARTMPKQKPGRSETVVRTPAEFLDAVKDFLEIDEFEIDLAASKGNAVAKRFYTIERNALLPNQTWTSKGWSWCNPPYDRIAPWVGRAKTEARYHQIAMLVPASTGANWWRDYVHRHALVLLLNGRIIFNDKNGHPICSPKTGKPTPYPKDLALLLYGGPYDPDYDVWNWKRRY